MTAIQTATNETLKDVYLAATNACHKSDNNTLQAFAGAKNTRYRELNPKVA